MICRSLFGTEVAPLIPFVLLQFNLEPSQGGLFEEAATFMYILSADPFFLLYLNYNIVKKEKNRTICFLLVSTYNSSDVCFATGLAGSGVLKVLDL